MTSKEAPKQKFIALFRALNVGGNSIIKMADLRKMIEALGFSDVATYIQSGNVLFTSEEKDAKQLARQLERKLKTFLGKGVTVFVLTPAELKKAAANNPFNPERLDVDVQSHLMFLSDEPDGTHRNALLELAENEYRFSVHGKMLYYAYPRAFAGKRRTINFEKVLGVSGTARTWKVINKLIELADSKAGQ